MVGQANRHSILTILIGAATWILSLCFSTTSFAQTNCGTNDPDTPTKRVCATWDQGGNPEEGSHFTVEYDCTDCSDAPRVKLESAAAWTIYSEVISTGAAANIGDILIHEDAATSATFTLQIKKNSSTGADDVGSIDLDGAAVSGWTGHSSLSGALVSGDVGEIDLVASGTTGGEVSGAVNIVGGIEGPVTIPYLRAVISTLVGDYGADDKSNNIDIGVIEDGGGFEIAGDLRSASGSEITVDIDRIGDTTGGTGGTFKIGGDFTNAKAVMTITEIQAPAGEDVHVEIGGDFGGLLNLKNGVPGASPDASVTIIGTLLNPDSGGNGGKIDLRDDANENNDVGGTFILGGAEVDATVVGGGDILGTGTFYPCQSGGEFKGTASFENVVKDGSIWAFNGCDVSGDITVTGYLEGLFRINGDLLANGSILIKGDIKANSGNNGLLWVAGNVASNSNVTVEDDVIGHIHITKDFDGDVVVQGSITSSGLFLAGDDVGDEIHDGDLTVNTNLAGDIDLDGDVSGTYDIDGDASGDASIDGDLSGTFNVDGDVTGEITVADDCSGDILIGGLLGNGADIIVHGALTGGGEITIDGECQGDIIIDTSTASLSVIHLAGGVSSTGSLTINEDEGNYNAGGTIAVGSLSGLPVTGNYDGVMRVKDNSLGNYGDLDGTIRIAMCDNEARDHVVCIEGDGEENITVVDDTCENQADVVCLEP